MKKRIIWTVIIIILALVGSLLAWRFWPHSFPYFADLERHEIIGFSATAAVNSDDGLSSIDFYQIELTGDTAPITQILSASDYRQDLRNLLPWDIDSVGSDTARGGIGTVTLQFYEDDLSDWVTITFLSSSLVTVSEDGDSDYEIYHPTNPEVLNQLVQYLQTHGVKS